MNKKLEVERDYFLNPSRAQALRIGYERPQSGNKKKLEPALSPTFLLRKNWNLQDYASSSSLKIRLVKLEL